MVNHEVMKECLIVGRGPSKDEVLDKEFDTDIICCKEPFHKDTMLCISADLTSFCSKEINALEQNFKLVLGLGPQHMTPYGLNVPPEGLFATAYEKGCLTRDKYNLFLKNNLIEIERNSLELGTGEFAIFWAATHGYRVIYTAGLDFKVKDGVLPRRWGEKNFSQEINNFIQKYISKGIEIYKISDDSVLDVPIKFPSFKRI